ncbi:Undecaprenyl-phosphate galactosephosphotransferase [Caldibacillus thermoamylovorans]|nr:Undecaprenyl-phosphate galactosephosphotransferase [Caldibacillus thermoamylovorans]
MCDIRSYHSLALILIISFLIKLEDKDGPVIFKQYRVGKDGKLFYMYKFRSMVANAEELKAQLMEKTKQRVQFLK